MSACGLLIQIFIASELVTSTIFVDSIWLSECRAEVMEWEKEVKKLSARLLSILSEGLGLSGDRLSPESYLARINMVGQYYPYCPKPDKTIGIASHSDHGTLTVLLQDDVGGLQVKYNEEWIDLKPVRVYANPLPRSRIYVPVFFNLAITSDKLYGHLPELVSPEKPALYKQFTISYMNAKFLKKELKDKTV
ncbi:1-aminocyclopropane-1-carboxylate oxidase homolog 10-like [Silene latifolia]|uniref:1-aminocyclopropane-1-carboxylate oxidase homolog 10-like n=1 Tax=Silene latifolia TaxID=37657 RepID=UPI003D778C1D